MIGIARLLFICFVLVYISPAWAFAGYEDLSLYDVAEGKVTSLSKILPELKQKRIIFIGEFHTEESHHKAQLSIIKALHEPGLPVALGLEMFRSDSQNVLDQWHQGKLDERDFQKAYYDNWGYPWSLYSEIFKYAKTKKIPLVGLNIPRNVTQKVARGGFRSLSKEDKENIPFVECNVDPEYMAFIKRAYGSHAHGQLDFTNFCEAQLVWDKVMAVHALRYVESNPPLGMVILAGTGHAWKKGIPAQISQRSSLPYTVILPQAVDGIDRGTVTTSDADYVILGVSR